MSGLFRGLDGQQYIFHPDEAKQVLALLNYLNDVYVHYYGSRGYDGYPYGLNHLDEYLMRPVYWFLGADAPENNFSLYYVSRFLRVVYGMVIVTIAYKLTYKLVEDKVTALLAMLLLAIGPVSIAVAHYATGDIGVDLFTAIALLFLYSYTCNKYKKTYLFACGFAVGAAFSAKYNGILTGMVPGMVLCFELAHNRNYLLFVRRGIVLVAGVVAGTLIFTPNLHLDFDTTVSNFLMISQYIKDYNVPAEIVAKPWAERAILGLKDNTIYIISSLGYVTFFATLAAAYISSKEYMQCFRSGKTNSCTKQTLILAIALFPIITLLISLIGKYAVQPFHFSSLQLPLILITCFLFYVLRSSKSLISKGFSLILAVVAIFEYGRISWQENFFWRHEDNHFYEQYLPPTIFTQDALAIIPGGSIRSLFLESYNTSVFRNIRNHAMGPDAQLWHTIGVAPLPQVPNLVGRDWIFLNGPTFPRNERMIFVHGGARGTTVTKQLVLPAGQKWPSLGLRSGSYPVKVKVNYGSATTTVSLEAHQQKTIDIEPKNWKVSPGRKADEKDVNIVPLTLEIPHDDAWVTILTTQQEKEYFTLFGGGQEHPPTVPKKVPQELEQEYLTALDHLLYMNNSTTWDIIAGQNIPVWEVPLSAGHYRLTCEVEGFENESAITIEFEDANGGAIRLPKQHFEVRKGVQQLEYSFTKPFVPYQGRFLIRGISGKVRLLELKLFPEHRQISKDFATWRSSGIKPKWVSRFGE